MELDDLKALWATVEQSRALDERILRELTLGRVRSTLRPSLVWRALEVVLGLAVLLLCAPAVVAHGGMRYLVLGIPSLVFIAVMTAASAYLLVRLAQLDYDGPLLAIQRSVAELRRVEYRATLHALLGGVMLWLPIGLLLVEAITSAPLLGVVDLAWLLSNVALGLVVLVVGRVLARRHLERLSPRGRRIVDALSGRALRSVSVRLDELARFAE